MKQIASGTHTETSASLHNRHEELLLLLVYMTQNTRGK